MRDDARLSALPICQRTPGPNSRTTPPGRNQLPIGRIVFSLALGGLYIKHGAIGELAAQLAGLRVDIRVGDGAPNQLSGIGWRPLGILSGKLPQLPVGILDLDVKNLRIGDPGIDNRPAHRAQDIERRSIECDYAWH